MTQGRNRNMNRAKLFQRKKFKWQKRKHTNEEMLTIPCYKENTNQNHVKIPPHPC
jgi:hypothetical protein